MTVEATTEQTGAFVVRHVSGYISVRGADHYLEGFVHFNEQGSLPFSLLGVVKRLDGERVEMSDLPELAPAITDLIEACNETGFTNAAHECLAASRNASWLAFYAVGLIGGCRCSGADVREALAAGIITMEAKYRAHWGCENLAHDLTLAMERALRLAPCHYKEGTREREAAVAWSDSFESLGGTPDDVHAAIFALFTPAAQHGTLK